MNDLRTTLLIPSLHCPTCTNFIEEYAFSLSPPPLRIDVSILQHQVFLIHDESFDIIGLCEYFGLAGYQVTSKSTVRISTGTFVYSQEEDNPYENHLSSLNYAEHENHLLHCASCRNAFPTEQDEEKTIDEKCEIQVEKEVQTFIAQLSIEGMSCSSCVGKVNEAIDSLSWVVSSNVALLSNSAIVTFTGQEKRTKNLIETIEDLGYEANLENVELVKSAEDKQSRNSWKARYSIKGMTCTSCVNQVTEAIKELPFVRSTNVNLLLASMEVEVEGKDKLSLITETVEGLGYEAQLEETKEIIKQTKEEGTQRTVMIKVEGMTCNQCPLRVSDAIKNRFGERVKVQSLPAWQKAIFNISYTPHSPDLTIRTILQTINGRDSAFSASLIQPATIEEKAQKMHARIRLEILYRAILSFIIAIPTFIIGIVYMNLLSNDDYGKMYLMKKVNGVSRAEWSLFVLATPVYFFAADLFHRKTAKELDSLWRPGSKTPFLRRFYRFGSMDMLMCLGTSIAYFSSIAELIIAATSSNINQDNGSSYFDSVVFLTMFLLFGRLLEAFTKEKTGEAVSKLGKLRPNQASLFDQKTKDIQIIPINHLESGDLVLVVHGSSPPWDGIIVQGSTIFSESSLTGESSPVKKDVGDKVFSGTINIGDSVLIQLTGASGKSMLDQIISVVREGQSRRAPIERIADRLTSHFVPAITGIAIMTWIVWLSLGLSGSLPSEYLDISVGGWPFWSLQFAISVFVIACPCGIGLAAPTALFVGGGLAAQYGILAKGGGEAFQEASKIDIVVFDKTGTLTKGDQLAVTDEEIIETWDNDLIKQSVWLLEQNSTHPIAKSITKSINDSMIHMNNSLSITSSKELPGKGMKGYFTRDNQSFEVIVGNERLLSDHQVTINRHSFDLIRKWQSEAKTVVMVARKLSKQDFTISLMFALSDEVRPEARNVIQSLHKMGVETWMISGDNIKTAKAISSFVGISSDHVIAGVLPEEKAKKVQELQKKREIFGKTLSRRAIVTMVGDGVNDSPALAIADVGIAIGSGSDVALSAASFVLVNSNLDSLLTLFTLSRSVFRRVKFNFLWALLYNLIALPVAAGVLYPIKSSGSHIRLNPVWASLAMALSSISVVCSSLLLRTRIPILGYTSYIVNSE